MTSASLPRPDDDLDIVPGPAAGRALEAILARPWAIDPTYLRVMVEIATRAERDVDDEGLQAVLTRRMGRLRGTSEAVQRDGVAVLPVVGPIFRRANIFTRISGGTSTELLARDFREALDDDAVRAIVLSIDSPGGEVNGIAELQEHIFRARGQKPIVAHVADQGASAAFWLASAASQVIAAPTAHLGSIGVVGQVRRRRKGDGLEVISTQSPRKHMDPDTDEGLAAIQEVVDDVAQVFVDDVARNRGVDVETVLSQFGQGGVLVGARAVEAGLADRLATLEDVIAELVGGHRNGKEVTMTQEAQGGRSDAITADLIRTQHPDIAAVFRKEGQDTIAETVRSELTADLDARLSAARAEGAEAERARIQGVLDLGLAGHDELITTLAFDGKTSPEQAAVQVLKAEQQLGDQALERRRKAAPDPVKPTASETGEESTPPTDTDAVDDETLKARWDRDPKVRDEFLDFEGFAAHARAKANGQVRVLGR